MNQKELAEIKQAILKKVEEFDTFACLVSDPDEDAIASGLAMEEVLEQLGKNVKLYTSYDVEDYSYLPRSEKYIHQDIASVDLSIFECLIFLDCASPERVLLPHARIEEFKLPDNVFVINIDHHETKEPFGDLNYISTSLSSSSEGIYDIFKDKVKLTPSLSTNLLAAIIGDTDCFKHTAITTPKTLRIAADLIENNAKHKLIIQNIFYSFAEKVVDLNIDAIKNIKVKQVGKYRYAYATFNPKKFGFTDVTRDQRALTQENVIRTIKGIDFSIVITPLEDGIIKLSFRSSNVYVRPIGEHFGGGGHNEAAGATINMTEKEFWQKLEKYLETAELPEIKN
ncbi:DHH family phosphoesterase [Candidatus Dojkabacteria bacterium]|nr:DHH family phosphoesterase [Candidatus Dojkabacteria bacterium]